MILLALVVTGLAFGSFVNALVWRVHEQERLHEKKRLTKADTARLRQLSITKGRSLCMSCNHELHTLDLIPVISWLWLRGKCRYCGTRIPDTPVAELAVPLLFVISYLWWPWQLGNALQWAVLVAWLIGLVGFVALTLYDFRWYLLPDRIVFPLMAVGLLYRILLVAQADTGRLGLLLEGLWGVIVLAGLFYTLFVVSHERWIGGGDVKLAVVLGLLAGGPLAALLLLFVASFSGTFATVPLLVRGKPVRHAQIPFGPFLILATVVTVLFGQSAIDWYTGLFTLSNAL